MYLIINLYLCTIYKVLSENSISFKVFTSKTSTVSLDETTTFWILDWLNNIHSTMKGKNISLQETTLGCFYSACVNQNFMDKNINISGISQLVIGCCENEKKNCKSNMCPIYGKQTEKTSHNSLSRNTIDTEFKMNDVACNKIVHSKMCPLSNREYPGAVTHWVSTRVSPREQ